MRIAQAFLLGIAIVGVSVALFGFGLWLSILPISMPIKLMALGLFVFAASLVGILVCGW